MQYTRLAASLAFATIFSLATSAHSAVALSDLISNNDSFVSGGLVFSDFTFTTAGNVTPETEVNVDSVTDQDGNFGIRFQGGFADLQGGGSSGFTISYNVAFADPFMNITGAMLQGNPTAILSGVGSFTETFVGLGIDPLVVFDNANTGETDFIDSTSIIPPSNQLQVELDFFGEAGTPGGVTGSFVDQTFSGGVVPEISSIATWGILMLAVGCVCVLNRRFQLVPMHKMAEK